MNVVYLRTSAFICVHLRMKFYLQMTQMYAD